MVNHGSNRSQGRIADLTLRQTWCVLNLLHLEGLGYDAGLRQWPQEAGALNNLADVRRQQGALTEAAHLAQRALQLAVDAPLRSAVLDTLRQISSCGAHCK